jgi:hypothetical protein
MKTVLALAAAAFLLAAPAHAQSIEIGIDRNGQIAVGLGGGYSSSWGRSDWRDPRQFFGDYGYQEYCPRRGWRRGASWHSDPWRFRGRPSWAGSGYDRFDDFGWDRWGWDDRAVRRSDWKHGRRNGWRDDRDDWRGSDWRGDRWSAQTSCVRVVERDWWNGRPAFVSLRVCEDRFGQRFIDQSDRRFVGWAH